MAARRPSPINRQTAREIAVHLGTTDASVVAFVRGELKRESLAFRIQTELERRGLGHHIPAPQPAPEASR